MRFDKQKAFPYPVLRPSSDDYIDAEFQAAVGFEVEGGNIKANISFALSAEEIKESIDRGYAEYVCMVSCRDTYFQQIIKSENGKSEINFDAGVLRGEVRIYPYVVVKKNITNFYSGDINPEFGPGPFEFFVGDVLAQDETQVFYIDRDLFKPVTSVIDLVKQEGLEDGVWTVSYDENHIQIQVSPKMKESIDDARNDPKNRIILKNSLYFSAVMQAVHKLQDSQESLEGKKWAEVIRRQAHNKGLDLVKQDAYLITEHLLDHPLNLLKDHVFKGISS